QILGDNVPSDITIDDDELFHFFHENGLDSNKWSPIFIDADIISFSDIRKIKEDKNKLDQIMNHANIKEKEIFSYLFHMEAGTIFSQAEITLEVTKIGLDDANYWIPILAKYFGVRSKLGLQCLGPDSYLTINQFSRNLNETEIIKKLCNVPFGHNFDEWQEKTEAKINIRLTKLKLLFNDLVKMKESNSLPDDLIKQKMYQYLELIQKNGLFSDKDEKKADIFHIIFEEVKSTIKYMDEYKTESKENANENNIKQLVSQCLSGILISDSLNDQCKQRECVLKVPDEIRIQPPIIPEISETHLYFTLEDELCFKSCLETLGYSTTTLINSKGFYGNHSNKEYLTPSKEKGLPLSAIDYTIVPVASCVFDVKNFKFCSDAISKLKTLEEVLLQTKPRAAAIQKLCDDFFSVYGSHINFGVIHFGGIFMFSRKSHEYKNYQGRKNIFHKEINNLNEVKNEITKEINNLNEVKNEIKNDMDISYESGAEYVEPSKVTVIGGSQKESCFSPWRHSLKINTKFWRVIDRGCNMIPAWEILKLNHATEFIDINLITECLSQGWERLVKIESNIPLFTETRDIDKEVNCITSQLESWISDENQLAKCEEHLSLLIQFKEDLHFKTKDPLAFARMVLTHPNMHSYIKSLTSLSENLPFEEVRHMHFLIKHIVSDSWYVNVDFCTKNSNEFTLPPNMFVLQIFEDYLKKLFCEFQGKLPKDASECIPTPMKGIINMVQNISCTLSYTFSELSRYDHTYGELLLMLILVPMEYSNQCKFFNHWYHINASQHILENIKHFEKLSVYKNDLEIQSFLLHLGLSFANTQDDKRKVTCGVFKDFLKDRLHPFILELLESYEDFEKLSTKLSDLFSGVKHKEILGEKTLKSDNDFEKIILEFAHIEQKYASLDLEDNDEIHLGTEINNIILKDLCLEEILSYNFGMKDILTITRSSLKGEEPQTLKEKILYIISKQVMLDYRSRNIQLCITSNDTAESVKSLQCDENRNELEFPDIEMGLEMDNNDEFESILMELIEESDSKQKTQNILHPSDVNVIIMNCCDNILRQIIVQKMAICQLAVPLIFPNFLNNEPVFLLWALRLMNMKWKTQSCGAQDVNTVDYPTPIVSAVRLGELSRSKSKILNDILCNQPHDIFFHRDCKAGNLSRKLSNGIVELAWYLPGGKKEDNFDSLMALANLRADAKNHSKQFELLSKVSSVMLVFLSLETISDPESSLMLKKLSMSNQQLVFIFLGSISHISQEKRMQSFSDFKKVMGDKRFKTVLGSVKGQVKNAASLTAELRKQIHLSLRCNLGTESCTEQLDWETVSDIARCIGIRVDEDNKSCQQGKNMASIIINELQSKDVTTIKEQLLPLQGQLWSEWSRFTKMQARMDGVLGKNQEAYISELHSKKKICREGQYKLVENLTPVMKNFIQNLMQTKNNPEFRISFMQWMKLRLDGISHKELPALQMMYHSLWNDIQDQKIKKLNDTLIRGTQNQLDEVERNLIATSFGLEHFMREVGQVYEAIVENKNDVTDENIFYLLPQFAADLLISGFPLEIMDGDASHMPLTWVKAVFDRLKVGLGDKKLYVISVLGVQSSGKSTLLNTMFGLNFAVSAGRCTKGVFAQLIPVENHLNTELGYDYILVLDTEGLRAPELGKAKLSHDNELATLVIGMGDITILNIKGENTAEIEDILQISVHAFLRMRLVNKSMKLQPGCYFVHQNVPAVNAAEKMLYGYKKLQEQLDIMTIAAAEQENASEIQSFRDVIEFDVKNNVWYFSSLWQGDPPMAPANPSYSEKVLDLKTNLLKYPSQKKINCLTFTDLQHRMTDLWNAILYENFVFSFKNSLEVKSYSHLEEKFSLISWTFRNEVKKWIHGSINEIQSCEEKNISSLHGSLISSLLTCIEDNLSNCKHEMDNFFLSSKDKDILVQWKSNTDIKLQNLSDELKSEAMKTCERHIEMLTAQFVRERKTDSYKKQLQMFVKELVSTNVEEKMSDESLKEMFSEKWNDWIEVLNLEHNELEQDILGDVLTILSDHFKKYSKLLQIEIAKYEPIEIEICDLDYPPIIDEEDFKMRSSIRRVFSFISLAFFDHTSHLIEIRQFTSVILHEIRSYLNEKKGQDYDNTFVWDICNLVKKKIKMFNSESRPYALHINYEIKVTVHILRNVIPHFKIMHRQYRKKNDPQHNLVENFKPQLQKLFFGTYSQCMQEKTAADILSTTMEKAILASLMRDLPRKIAEDFTTSNSAFHTKLKLYAKVMEDLGTMRHFEKYLQYLDNPNISMESWLEVYVGNYCSKINEDGNNNLGNAANELLRNTVMSLINCVKEVKASGNTNCISFQVWLQKYNSIAKRIVPLSDTLFSFLDLQQIEDIDNFEELIMQGLQNIQNKLEKVFSTWSLEDLGGLDENPHMLIAKNILGCQAQCPFCNTICINTIADHAGASHSAPLHHPQCFTGYRDIDSQILVLDSCNVDVAGDRSFRCFETCYKSHKYKEYRTVNEYFASWNISPDTSLEASAYWKWVFCQFSIQFAKHHKAICPEIPHSWRKITWEDAKKSIWSSCYL
ncbi:unnamed protein product, partial [Meganyctiphanes norvegica]